MPLHSPTTALTSAHHHSPPPFFHHFGGSLTPPTSCLHPSIMALSALPLTHHCTHFRSPPHLPSPICDFCSSLPLLQLPHRSVMAFSAHPSGTFIAFPASLLAHHHTRLHPSVTFAALYLFHGHPIVPLWHSRPIPLVHSSPSRPLHLLTTALTFTHL